MFGFEIVALITAIIGVYPAIAEMYNDWRRKHPKRQLRPENKELYQQLKSGGNNIQQEYDKLFRELGRVFAYGDVTLSLNCRKLICKLKSLLEISRAELIKQLKTLDRKITPLLKSSEENEHSVTDIAIHPNHERIQRLSAKAQRQAIYALVEQYQRLRQAAPIRVSYPRAAQLALTQRSHNLSTDSRNVSIRSNCFKLPTKQSDGQRNRRCRACGWTSTRISGTEKRDICFGGACPQTRDNRCIDWDCLRQKFHHLTPKSVGPIFKYRCFLCSDGAMLSIGALVNHVYAKHRWAEICGDNCSNESGKCGRKWTR